MTQPPPADPAMPRPPEGPRAWADRATRRALGRYGLTALAWSAAGLVCLLLGTETLDENGDTVEGVPEFVTFALMIPGLLMPLVTLFSLGCLALMTTAALRHPWRTVDSSYDLLPIGRNGQPVLTLDSTGAGPVRLAPQALVWRWSRFEDHPTMLLATGSRRWGLVATPDRRHVVWAARSPVADWYARRRATRPGTDES